MRGGAECKHSNSVVSIYGFFAHPNFCNNKFVRSMSQKVFMGIKMQLDTLREGNEKSIVQETKPFHK